MDEAHLSRAVRQQSVPAQVSCRGERLEIRGATPLLYWTGTVRVARLGSSEGGVFVAVWDVGRKLRLEAMECEGGPLLANSTVTAEAWTGDDSSRTRGV